MANPEILGSLEGGPCSKLSYMNHYKGIMVNRRMERGKAVEVCLVGKKHGTSDIKVRMYRCDGNQGINS